VKQLRPLTAEDELTVVGHLDELRKRLITSIVALTVVFGFCMWQSDALIDTLNRPLSRLGEKGAQSGSSISSSTKFQTELSESLSKTSTALESVAGRANGLTQADRDLLKGAATSLRDTADSAAKVTDKRRPITIGVSEPFTTTLTVALSFALLFTLPFILYQAYSFVVPALTKEEKRQARPLLISVPFLFSAGVLFCYFVVLPPAVQFLQGFNSDSFDILVQARDYYRFELFALLGLGLLFQLPVVIVGLTKFGVTTPKQLRSNRRYALLLIAFVAMLLPGTDPITMILAMLPLLVLYEGSILVSSWLVRSSSNTSKSLTRYHDE